MNKYLFIPAIALLSTFTAANAGSSGKEYSVADIKGNYGFSFDGQIVGVAPVAATGAFSADGKGNITSAVRTISVGGVPVTETFTCTLTVNPDGTGSAVCPLDQPAPGFPAVETFDFVLEDNKKAFRMVATTPGVVVLGAGRKQ